MHLKRKVMKNLMSYLLVMMLFIASCKNETAVQKVSYDDQAKSKNNTIATDTTKIEIADLPIQFADTKVLIHPIGRVQVSKKFKVSSVESYDSSDATSFKISNNNDNEITGFMSNLKFQQVGQDSLVALSDKKLFVQSVTYLKDVALRTKAQLLVYVLEDMDTNKDGMLNQDDINTLFISDINGKNLTKLSTPMEELIDWNMAPATNRLYFRTIEDSNKNGKFDKSDTIHYQYVNVLDKDFKVVKYNIN